MSRKNRIPIFNRVLAAMVAMAMMAGLLPGLSLPVFAANGTWDGDGTEQSPYLIEEAADLAKLASDVNGGNSGAGKYFRLTNDIDLTSWLTENSGVEGWTPIGTMEHPFSGNFDGAGKSISGLWINRPEVISVGLFGFVKDSSINDVTVTTQANNAVNGRFYVGMLAGYAFGGTISRCAAAGTVTGTSMAGGLTGNQYGGVIDGCRFSGTVTVSDASGGTYAGGLVGYTQLEAVLQNSYADAVVSGYQQIGGLVGFLDGDFQSTVRDCFSTGSASGNTQIGGLAGGSTAELIERCYAATAVNGAGQYVGGLIGSNNTLTLRDCYATGAVSGSSSVGGLLGRQSSGEKNVSGCYATGRVSANGRAGGLIGEINVTYPSVYMNNFFDSSATAQANGTGSGQMDGIFGKTTAEMQLVGTFTGWDFTGDGTTAPTWYIREGETYPLLGVAVDYVLNGVPGNWADLDVQGMIYLRNDGDTLAILANKGPEKPVRIVAWPFSNAAASITGRPGVMYHNLSIQAVGENITLNLYDLQITAPEDQNGILVYSTDPEAAGPDSYAKLNVKGKCVVRGGDAMTANQNGIQVDSLNTMITGEHLEVYGGNGFNTTVSDDSGTDSGGAALYVTGRAKTTILDTEYLFLSGGNGYQSGGVGLTTNGPSLMKGGTITAVGGNCSITEDVGQYGGVGINTNGDFTMESGILTATAGQTVNPSNGLTVTGIFTLKNDSVVRAAGTNAAVYAQAALHLSGTASITAIGQNGGRGIWTRGEIRLSDTAQLTAAGGSSGTGTGGDGIYMMGNGKVTVDGGNLRVTGGVGDSGGKGINDFTKTGTITIGKGAGEVYIRGGRSKSGAAEASITSGNAYIATGNIGPVTVTGELKNALGGDTLYMLTATTSPLKPDAVFEAVVGTGAAGLSPSYTYRAAAKDDGIATMWLPEGEQTVTSDGYEGGGAKVPTDASVTLYNDFNITVNYKEGATVLKTETLSAALGGSIPLTAPEGYVLANGVTNSLTVDAALLAGGTVNGCTVTADGKNITVDAPVAPLDYMLTITYLDDGAFVGRQMETVPFDSDFSEFTLPKGYVLSGEIQAITVDSAISDHQYRSAAANVPLTKKAFDVTVQYTGCSGENNTQVLPGKRLGDWIAFAELAVPAGYAPVDFTDLILTASDISDTDTILIDVPVSKTVLVVEIPYTVGETVVGTQVKNMAKNEYLRKSDLNPPFGYCLSGAFEDVRITQAQRIAMPVEAVPARMVTVSPTAAVLVLNETPYTYLTAQVSPAVLDMGVTWSSEDETVATVDAYGKVTAVAKGFTSITAISRQTGTVIGRCMVTVANFGDPYVTTANVPGPGWSNAAYTVTLTGQSMADGDRIEFRLDNGEWTPYSGAITVSQEGETWLSWRVSDGTNSLSDGKFGPYLVDLTAPVITDQTATAASASQIDLSAAAADENGSGMAGYLWEVKAGENWVLLSTEESCSHTGLSSNTEYTYRLTVTDLAGNTAISEISAKTNRASSGGGGGTTYYTVKFDTNGGSAVETQRVRRNGKAVKPADPEKESFVFAGWYADSESAAEYDFDKGITGNLTLYAKWTAATEPVPPPSGPDGWKNPFIDVHESDWFYGNVEYVYVNGIFKGVAENAFEPDSPMTRAMLVTVLWRAEGQPEAGHSGFTDVPAEEYFTKAVAWAAENGMVKGYDEKTFAPNDAITREQLVTILFRYANYQGYDISAGADTNILDYADAEQIAEWAISAVQWAVGAGIINGRTQETIAPLGNATRAEVAAVLHRFLENVNKK